MVLLRNFRKLIIIPAIIIISVYSRSAAKSIDIDQVLSNMDDRNEQTVLTGAIDSMVISRPHVEFRFGPGNLIIFDFGASRPSAMVYEGKGRFHYTPPDKVELGQLLRFTDKDMLDEEFEKLTMFFTIEIDDFPDTADFTRETVSKDVWSSLDDVADDAFDHIGIHMPNKVIGDIISESPGFYFYADFKTAGVGHLVFQEDATSADHYRVYKLVRSGGSGTFDVLGGFSTDDGLPSRRGISPIDITGYRIFSTIEGTGKMQVDCRINFNPFRWACSFLYLDWYYKNRNITALDSDGDTLRVVHRKDESGFGLVLNKPLEIGQADSIDISYECRSLTSSFGILHISGQTSWFPSNPVRDCATFELNYDCPKSYEIISCGNKIESAVENGRSLSKWITSEPVEYVSFNIGVFESREIVIENMPPVKVYMSEQIDHREWALLLAYFGELSTADMLGAVSADVTNSLAFFGSLFGPCPFDTIKATELATVGYGQGSPGLIHLSWDTFQMDDIEGYDEMFRAHEVSHQWWGHLVDIESYRDVWITEGLANYSGLWFYEMSSKNTGAVKGVLGHWRDTILSGRGGNSMGSRAGPIILGIRLSSTKSSDYSNLVYRKGAYAFQMIRYMLHDYKTGSDDAFAAFLKDIVDTFQGKVITTQGLQSLLEKHAGAEMGWFFDQWVYGTGIPEYTFSYDSEITEDDKHAVVCHVKQENVPDDFQMPVPITVLFEDDRYIHLKLWIDQPEADIDLPRLPFEPKKIVFNTYDAVLCKVKYR